MRKEKERFSLKDIVEKIRMNEVPIAVNGNWDNGKEGINIKDIRYDYFKKLDKEVIFESVIKGYDIIIYFENDISRISINYLFEDESNEVRLREIGYYKLSHRKDVEKLKSIYKLLYEVEKAYIEKPFRGVGLGSIVYLSILETLKFNIISNGVQFDGPRYLYKKFSHFETIYCDIVDLNDMKILKENYKIINNPVDINNLDNLVWDKDPFSDKDEIRIILYTSK